MRIRSWAVAVTLGLAASAAQAQALSPEKVAKIRREQQAAMAKIDKAHGNKEPSELSNEERRQIAAERAAAEAAVLEKHGTSTREYTNYTLRMGTDERQVVEAEEKRLADAAAKKAAEAKKNAAAKDEVQVQKGFDEANPVDLEEKAGAPPKVEYGEAVETVTQ